MVQRRLVGLLMAATAALAGTLVAAPRPPAAAANTFTVTTTDDYTSAPCDGVGSCTLRAAIARSIGTSTEIKFSVDGTFSLDKDLGELMINGASRPNLITNLSILGNGATRTIIDGKSQVRVFDTYTATVTLSGLTVQDGIVPRAGEVGGGAGLLVGSGADVTVLDSTVQNNTAHGPGGGIEVANEGGTGTSLTVRKSTVFHNQADKGGGIHVLSMPAINARLAPQDGTMFPSVHIYDSMVSANSSDCSGGGVSFEGVQIQASITRSAIVGNDAGSNDCRGSTGAAIYNASSGSTLAIGDSTISGNRVSESNEERPLGVGIANPGVSTVALTGSTVFDNSMAIGGGLSDIYSNPEGKLTLLNTIVATTGGEHPIADCSGGIESLGHNLATDKTCNLISGGDIVNAAPKLGVLHNNGGPTQTHALLPGSPAINAGDNAACSQSQTDQRSKPRFPAKGPDCDIGAYEVQPRTLSIDPNCSPLGAPGRQYSVTVSGDEFTPDQVTLSFGGVPAGTAPVDESGHFSTLIKPLKRPPGSYELLALDQDGRSAAASFREPCVGPLSITLRPTCGPAAGSGDGGAHDRVQVDGQGFTPGKANLTFAGVDAGTAVVDQSGHFSAEINPAKQPPGSYEVRASNSDERSASANFQEPCAPPPAISLSPGCGEAAGPGDAAQQAVQVEGKGFTPGKASLFFAGAPAGTADVGDSGSLSITITASKRPPGTYQVRAVDTDGRSASASFREPCVTSRGSPTITLDPACGLGAGSGDGGQYSIRVYGSGFTPGKAGLSFAGTPAATADVNKSGHFSALIKPSTRPPGSYSVAATDPQLPAVAAEFSVPCFKPRLEVTPTLGPAGYTTTARGTGFPASSTVALRWSTGLTEATLARVPTDSSGAFTVTVLVFSHDPLGPRQLIATPAPGAAQFNAVQAQYLVVASSVQPPAITGGSRQPDRPLVFRR